MNWNNYLFQKIYSGIGRGSFMDAVALFFAEYFTYFLIFGVIFWIFSKPTVKAKFRAFSFVFLSVLISRGILTELIRYFYKSERPFVALGFEPLVFDGNPSFPSGHAALLFAMSFSIFFINRKLGIWFMISAILVSLARIYAGVHWPLDILGGIAVALIGTYISHLALKKAAGDKAVVKDDGGGVV